MSKEKEHWYKNNWVINIGSGIVLLFIAPLVPIVIDWIKNDLPVLITLKDWSDYIYHNFLTVINFQFKLWWLLVGFISLLIIRVGVVFVGRKPADTDRGITVDGMPIEDFTSLLSEERVQKVVTYKADKFDRLIWQWEWIKNRIIGGYEIKNIVPLCPNVNCDNHPLKFAMESNGKYYHHCEKCNASQSTPYTTQNIEDAIQKRIVLKFGFASPLLSFKR